MTFEIWWQTTGSVEPELKWSRGRPVSEENLKSLAEKAWDAAQAAIMRKVWSNSLNK